MTHVVFDIETIPTQRLDIMADIVEGVLSHNAKLKSPHDVDEVKRLLDEAYRKTSLDASTGEIVCIGAAIDDGPPQSWHRDYRVDGSEAALLTRFRDDLHDALDGRGAFAIGHNAVGFDRPFLRQRGMVCGVALPSWLTATLKPWEATDVDTMLMWTGSPGKMISLDNLARALRVGRKSVGISGAKVWDAVLEGRILDVATYCEADVSLTRDCWKRMRQPGS